MDYQTLTTKESREAAIALSDAVNRMSFKEKDFADEAMKQHRTLQQGMFRAFVACVAEWSKMYESGRYDLRNEQTVKAANRLWNEVLKDEYFPYI